MNKIQIGSLYKLNIDTNLPRYLYTIDMYNDGYVICLVIDNPYFSDHKYSVTTTRFEDYYELVQDV